MKYKMPQQFHSYKYSLRWTNVPSSFSVNYVTQQEIQLCDTGPLVEPRTLLRKTDRYNTFYV